MSRRDQIVLAEDEVAALLDEERVVTCATLGRDGWPHLMPLWYVIRDRTIWAWTYGKSQKVRNLERDARCTLQVEAGRDLDTVTGVGLEIARRYSGGADIPEAPLRKQAAKRVAVEFRERERATWDHRKL